LVSESRMALRARMQLLEQNRRRSLREIGVATRAAHELAASKLHHDEHRRADHSEDLEACPARIQVRKQLYAGQHPQHESSDRHEEHDRLLAPQVLIHGHGMRWYSEGRQGGHARARRSRVGAASSMGCSFLTQIPPALSPHDVGTDAPRHQEAQGQRKDANADADAVSDVVGHCSCSPRAVLRVYPRAPAHALTLWVGVAHV
jgi:hypothetical protein